MAPSTKTLLTVLLTVFAAALPAAWLWGFMVDDALISARVAHHLATARGYRFNASGPVVDAVTPLGWAPLLAPFARTGPLAAFAAAKWIGLLAWLGGALVLGTLVAKLDRAAATVTALLTLSLSAPLAAWAVSGMETGVVVALATVGLVDGRAAPLALGLAAGLRPELLPWAVTLSVARAALGRPKEGATRLGGVLLALALSATPFLVVATIRFSVFGQALPLSAVAKPADPVLGVRYALGALLLSGPAWLLVARRTYRRASARTHAIVVALAAHLLALVQAGGDWMPFFRLFVPVLPSLVIAGAEIAALSPSKVFVVLRALLTAGVSLALGGTLGPAARAVGDNRQLLIESAKPWLRGAQRIVALDVGWVGAASSADIVDLAGVTDPAIAVLPGSHTAKRLPEGLLEVRAVDALVVFVEAPAVETWPDLVFVHPVEARLSTLLSFSEFRPVAALPLRGTTRGYIVARRDFSGAGEHSRP